MPSAINLISEFAPEGRRSTMITVMSSFYSVGAVLSALLAIAVIPQWGWQAVFYVAVLPVFAVPFMLRYLPESAAFLALKGRRGELDQLLVKVDPAYRPGTALQRWLPKLVLAPSMLIVLVGFYGYIFWTFLLSFTN